MTTRLEVLKRPAPDVDYRSPSGFRVAGTVIGFVGLVLAVVTLIANIAAGNLFDNGGSDVETARETLAWSFGLTTTAFATIKVAIAVVLIGIVVRLWMRVDSVKAALPRLKAHAEEGHLGQGTVRTPFGAATESATPPKPLPVHKMARRLWAPMLVMGAMAVVVGLIVSFVWASDIDSNAAAAWTQGLQFLGEGFLLSGIAFLLGTILGSLRAGGGEVQESLGLTVRTLRMPTTAKLFVGLMMIGLMVAVLQFILYIVAATVDDPRSFASWSAWLGPFRELGLGLILAGIVLALASIANALGFQFSRIKEIIATGR